jgi:hypothetical protein
MAGGGGTDPFIHSFLFDSTHCSSRRDTHHHAPLHCYNLATVASLFLFASPIGRFGDVQGNTGGFPGKRATHGRVGSTYDCGRRLYNTHLQFQTVI